MELSPKYHKTIEYVEGSPSDIILRGHKITILGEQMLNSANVLESIKTESFEFGGMKGKAIDVLRESIGESHEVLKQAGELYKPVGPFIEGYGEALEELQPKIKSAVDDCEDLWAYYDNLPGDRHGSSDPEAGGSFLGMGGYDADSAEAQRVADENQAAKEAYEAWKTRAEDWDDYYEDWSGAFKQAADGISDEMADSIKDGFWEVLGDIGDILGTIGLIVGIAALVLGGPFTAIALALSAAALAVAVVQTFEDGKLGWDDVLNVGIAALGVLPFGKFSKVIGGETTFLKATLQPLTSFGDEVSNIRHLSKTQNLASAIFRNGNPGGFSDLFTRITLGTSASDLGGISDDMVRMGTGGQLLTSHLDILGGLSNQLWTYYGWAGQLIPSAPEAA